MEGPSLKIACEELRPFIHRKVVLATGSFSERGVDLTHSVFSSARSWGKHLLLRFGARTLRIHFLMFGSYRINKPRPKRIPKLELMFSNGTIYFYSCAVKVLESPIAEVYDFTTDLMSPRWDAPAAVRKLAGFEKSEVADILLDQTLFSGLGNIIKNEVLFRLRLHPETKVEALGPVERRRLVKDAHTYSWLFYAWKKQNVLKRNWQIFRKKNCPVCGGKVSKRKTGKLERICHYCPKCQKQGVRKLRVSRNFPQPISVHDLLNEKQALKGAH